MMVMMVLLDPLYPTLILFLLFYFFLFLFLFCALTLRAAPLSYLWTTSCWAAAHTLRAKGGMSKEKEDEGGKTATAIDNQWIKRAIQGQGKDEETVGWSWVCGEGAWKERWQRTERRWRSGGFDVDQLWIWCFVCAAIIPRSARKMRKASWKPLLGSAYLRPNQNKEPVSTV